MAVVTLRIEVSDVDGVKWYVFTFKGQKVEPFENGSGEIRWDEDSDRGQWLHWDMVGEPGGSMHVTVLRGDQVLSERVKSTIPQSRPAGFDEMPIPQAAAKDQADA